MAERSSRSKRILRQLLLRWGDPDQVLPFDRTTSSTAPVDIEVAVWHPNDDCAITSFNTVGMSERRMVGADYLTELNLGVRGARLPERVWRALAVFVANVACYPYHHDLKLDWWESLKDPGIIPAFPGFTQLMLSASLDGEGLEWFESPDNDVKLIRLVPITPYENHVLAVHGRESFLGYTERERVDLFSPSRPIKPISGV